MRTQITSGFTLMELAVTVVMLGVISAFTIPNYLTAIEKQRERAAMVQLQSLHIANQIYFAQMNKAYFDANTTNPEVVNAALKTSVMLPAGQTFSYNRNTPSTYTATISLGTKTIRLNQTDLKEDAPNANPCCSAGTCALVEGC